MTFMAAIVFHNKKAFIISDKNFMKKFNSLLVFLYCFNFTSIAQTINIGTQVWMAKNLDVCTFRNGDQILQARTNNEWIKAGENNQPAWCYYDNDSAKGTKFGKLYNWHTVNDPRGLAPIGYHIPMDAEWTVLINFLGGESQAGKKMKSLSGWKENGYMPK